MATKLNLGSNNKLLKMDNINLTCSDNIPDILKSMEQRLCSLEHKIDRLLSILETKAGNSEKKEETSACNTDELTDSQKKALEYLKTGNNCFITGGAGVGKTFLLDLLTIVKKSSYG